MGADVILASRVRVDEHTTTIDHVPVFYRSASESGSPKGILYLHDAISSSEDFLPFLERIGGTAPDLIGFGRSSKGGHLDYSPSGLTDFLEEFVDAEQIAEADLVGHGWGGALALLLAGRRPGLARRLVLIDAVPLLDGYTWHGPARVWRRRLVGELAMGSTPHWLLARQLRGGATHPDTWSDSRVAAAWERFDQGTQRALLRLHRSADEPRLAELGEHLGEITSPTLVLWGDADPWFPSRFADAYAARLADATVEHISDAGHWPWLDQPHVVDRVAAFLGHR
jgi:pimeloyl-ACP methyl ester carboxylesterase